MFLYGRDRSVCSQENWASLTYCTNESCTPVSKNCLTTSPSHRSRTRRKIWNASVKWCESLATPLTQERLIKLVKATWSIKLSKHARTTVCYASMLKVDISLVPRRTWISQIYPTIYRFTVHLGSIVLTAVTDIDVREGICMSSQTFIWSWPLPTVSQNARSCVVSPDPTTGHVVER